MKLILSVLCLNVVPPPGVEVSVDSSQFHTDSIVKLICTINLPSAGRSTEMLLNVTWYGPSGQLRNSSNVTISGPFHIADQVLQSSLTITNYVRSTNNGEYICNASVIPVSAYIIGKSADFRRTISISG